MTRSTLYVDGFNFYYGVTRFYSREKNLAGLGWCNFRALVERHYNGTGALTVKYFTAPVTPAVELPGHRPGEHDRYQLWMRALRTNPGATVIEGKYKQAQSGNNPDGPLKRREEKQTDVNLAVEMVLDAFASPVSRPDHVFVLSGDCDQMPAVFALQERVPTPPRITVLIPSQQGNPQEWQQSYEITRQTLAKCHITPGSKMPRHPVEVRILTEEMLANSLLDYRLHDPRGEFSCPEYWRLPAAYLDRQCHHHEWRPDRV